MFIDCVLRFYVDNVSVEPWFIIFVWIMIPWINTIVEFRLASAHGLNWTIPLDLSPILPLKSVCLDSCTHSSSPPTYNNLIPKRIFCGMKIRSIERLKPFWENNLQTLLYNPTIFTNAMDLPYPQSINLQHRKLKFQNIKKSQLVSFCNYVWLTWYV